MPTPHTASARLPVSIAAVLAIALSLSACASPGGATSTPARTVDAQAALGSSPSYLEEPSKTATVTVVEFFDFQCPPCGRLAPVIEELADDYRGQVDFATRNFPLPMHGNAMAAALAGEAAAQQNAFGEVYSAIFEQQAEWSELSEHEAAKTFRDIAESLDLDLAAWDAAVADPATKRAVQEDVDAGTSLGVQGTPTLFINGVETAPSDAEDLRKAIDAALDAAEE